MERTQVYLDESEKEMLIKAAKKKGRPMAELIREAVSDYLLKEEISAKIEDDPIKQLRGFIKNNEFSTEDYFKQKMQDKDLEK